MLVDLLKENVKIKKKYEVMKENAYTLVKEIERLNKALLDIKERLYNDDFCHTEKLQEINKLINKALGSDK